MIGLVGEAEAGSVLTEDQVGLIFFFVSVGYCALIILMDSPRHRRLVISKNLPRHLLDGLTLATGVTVRLAMFH